MTAQTALRTSTIWRQNTMPCSADLGPRTSPLSPGASCSSIVLKSEHSAWLFIKVLLDLLLLLLLLQEEILLLPTYTELCTPSSCYPLLPSLVPFYHTVSQFRSLIWQKTNSAIKKKEIVLQQISDLDQLIMWWVPEHDPESGEDSGLKQKFSMLGSCGSLVWKATSLFRWVQL